MQNKETTKSLCQKLALQILIFCDERNSFEHGEYIYK